MPYKPFHQNFAVDRTQLRKDYPEFLRVPIMAWVENVLRVNKALIGVGLTDSFCNELRLDFHQDFHQHWDYFKTNHLIDPEFMTEFLNYLLFKFGNENLSTLLEAILSRGNSAYKVVCEKVDVEVAAGIIGKRNKCFLEYRVLEIVQEQAREILTENKLLKEAWDACYSLNPDDERVVSRCTDALESLFQKEYFPKDTKPQLGKYVNDFNTTPSKLHYPGSTFMNPKSTLTDLLKEFPNIRGQHQGGTGRAPTHDEAIFVLQYTLFVFSLFRKPS